jgi:hypothetical protein
VPAEDLERLDDGDCARQGAPVVACGHDAFGTWVWAPDDETALGSLVESGYSTSLAKALRFARRNGASHVRFDCDAAPLDTEELDRHDA